MDRREFLKTTGCFSIALALGPGCVTTPRRRGDKGELIPNAWIRIYPDDRVVYVLDRVEMGQGTYTSQTTMVAEELGIDPASIEVVFAPVDSAYDNPSMGGQSTSASNSTKGHFEPLRIAAAAAHKALEDAAAELLGVSAAQLAQEQKVFAVASDSTRTARFGQLIELAPKHLRKQAEPRPRKAWRYLGKDQPRLDAAVKVFGEARFGLDVDLQGLRYASLWRGGTEAQRQQVAARLKKEAPAGLEVVALSEAVAVVGSDSHGPLSYVLRSREADWAAPFVRGDGWSSDELKRRFTEALESGDRARARNDGDVDEVKGDWSFSQRFSFPYLPHQPMEPLNCTAWVHHVAGKPKWAELWLATQAPDISRNAAARALDLDLESVEVHQTFLGGGFGRRGDYDMAVEAAELSAKLKSPVKVTWSREDDIQHGRYRPGCEQRIEVKVAAGTLAAWHHQVAAPSLLGQTIPGFLALSGPIRGAVAKTATDILFGHSLVAGPIAVECSSDLPYAIENLRVEHMMIDPGIPISFWRSNGASFNTFVLETTFDEVALHLKKDPLDYRLSLLAEHPRRRGVLEAVKKLSGWGKPLPAGQARGVALQESYSTCVAEVAEVSVHEGQPQVHKVFVAVDCGIALNPGIVRQQMESGVAWGLSAALYGQLDWQGGLPVQSNFHDLPVLRIQQAPEIETVVVKSDQPPTGVGEPGAAPIAPAVANALRQLGFGPFDGLPLRLGEPKTEN